MRIVALAAILLGAACSGQPDRSKGSNTTLYATPGAPGQPPQFSLDPPQRTQPLAFDRARLVGRWGNPPDDCSNPIVFREDGTYVPGGGTRNGRWELVGDYLTINGSPTRDAHRIIQVESLDDRQVVLQNLGALIRCPASG
jgi:hypothetical protein